MSEAHIRRAVKNLVENYYASAILFTLAEYFDAFGKSYEQKGIFDDLAKQSAKKHRSIAKVLKRATKTIRKLERPYD